MWLKINTLLIISVTKEVSDNNLPGIQLNLFLLQLQEFVINVSKHISSNDDVRCNKLLTICKLSSKSTPFKMSLQLCPTS